MVMDQFVSLHMQTYVSVRVAWTHVYNVCNMHQVVVWSHACIHVCLCVSMCMCQWHILPISHGYHYSDLNKWYPWPNGKICHWQKANCRGFNPHHYHVFLGSMEKARELGTRLGFREAIAQFAACELWIIHIPGKHDFA
jgi:hypothetical protein